MSLEKSLYLEERLALAKARQENALIINQKEPLLEIIHGIQDKRSILNPLENAHSMLPTVSITSKSFTKDVPTSINENHPPHAWKLLLEKRDKERHLFMEKIKSQRVFL